MSGQADKRELFEQFARVGHALGNAPRLVMLDVLAQGERSVEQLAEAAGLSVANASQHLQVLRRAGLVATRREGARVHYRPAGEDVVALWLSLRDVAEARLGEVERAARDYLGDEVEAIGRAELAERLRAGEVVVIDVRPRVEFAAGHIQGARSVPLDELEARLAEIPRRRRGGRLLPRPLLRLRARGGSPPASRRPARAPPRGRLARVAAWPVCPTRRGRRRRRPPDQERRMILRPFLHEPTACASYLFGCTGKERFAVVDPHVELVDEYLAPPSGSVRRSWPSSRRTSRPTTSPGLPALVAATGARAYLPEGAGVDFAHHPLADGEQVELGNTRDGAPDARTRPGPSGLPGRRPAPRHRRAVVRLHRRLAARRRRRPAGPARRRRPGRGWPACCTARLGR